VSRRLRIAKAAGVLHENWHQTQVGCVPASGIDANFESDAGNDETAYPAIPQSDFQRSS
jgi:hypothetical protein